MTDRPDTAAIVDVLEHLACEFEERARSLRAAIVIVGKWATQARRPEPPPPPVQTGTSTVDVDAREAGPPFMQADQAPAPRIGAFAPRAADAETAPLADRIVAAVQGAPGPLLRREVWKRLPGPAPSLTVLSDALYRLVSVGRLVRTGQTAGTRYGLGRPAPPSPRPPDAPAPVDAPPTPPPPVDRSPDAIARARLVKVSWFLLHQVFHVPGTHHVGDLVLRLHDRFGDASYDETLKVLRSLELEGAIVEVRTAKEGLHFAAGTAPVEAMKAHLLERVFVDAADYGLDRLLVEVPNVAHADANTLRRALEQLVLEKRLRVRTVGTMRRYARAA